MPYCPKCYARINYLQLYEKVEEQRNFYLDKYGYGEAEYVDTMDCTGSTFLCPECSCLLFEDWDKAENFLKKLVCDICRIDISDKKFTKMIKNEEYCFCSDKCQHQFVIEKVIEEI